MKVVKLHDALKSREITEAIVKGSVFVYPTDTLYGIGCNAENAEAVKRVCEAKQRPPDKPFSVIVPSKDWIRENTVISKENMEFVNNLLPGPYTIILKAKKAIPFVTSKEKTMGLRIPRNEFCDLIREQGILFVTTSVNLSEDEPVTSVKDIPAQMKERVDFAIDAGELGRYGSRVFDLTKGFEIVRF
ncbi:MAG: threonylcarbamoyl-AMP synthase [Candidatus Aenigmarchaeota archaeon]|nr:threonylcarbamoyl-AMP synthase [Candidatus Aenigmarchaeota archaeon]